MPAYSSRWNPVMRFQSMSSRTRTAARNGSWETAEAKTTAALPLRAISARMTSAAIAAPATPASSRAEKILTSREEERINIETFHGMPPRADPGSGRCKAQRGGAEDAGENAERPAGSRSGVVDRRGGSGVIGFEKKRRRARSGAGDAKLNAEAR